MKKKVASLLVLGAVLGVSLVGCSSGGSSDASAKKELQTALEKLQGYGDTYAVTNLLEAPDGDVSYLEVVSDGNSYTEYPVDTDGNVGTVSYDEASSYMLSDWLTKDGDLYIVSSDNDSNLVSVKLPETYAKATKDREVLFFDYMLENFSSIEKGDSQTIAGEEVSTYTCKLPAENTKYILGMGSYQLYDSVRKDYEDDENVVKLADYYCDNLNMSLACSDANVTVGIDKDGMLKYVSLEIGGLGTRMYYTKVVVTDGISVRSVPDFSNATQYIDTFREQAEYFVKNGVAGDATATDGIPNNEDSTEGTTTEESNTDSDGTSEEGTSEETTEGTEEVSEEDSSSEEN